MTARPKVLVATNGTVGDMLPFLTIARELSTRNHRVHLLVPKFQEALFQSQCIEYTTYGTASQYQSVLDDPDLWNERKAMGVAWRFAAPHLGVIKHWIQQQPPNETCVLLCHPFMVPAANIAKSARSDVRIVSAFLAPSNLCSSHDLPTAGSLTIPSWTPLSWRKLLWRMVHRWVIDPVFLPELNAFRAANKLPPVANYLPHMIGDVDATIGLFPAWYGAKQPDWPGNFFESHFPIISSGSHARLLPDLERFVSSGSAPIAFTPGTGHRHAKKFFVAALDALQRLGRRGLLVTPHAEQVPALPPDVMWIDRAPFDLLMPRLAAFVHHGGIGTTVQAFRAGIPQLIVPYAFDQFENAWRAAHLGVAEVVLPRRLSARRLHMALDQLLSSGAVAQSCSVIRRRMETEQDSSHWNARVEEALGLRQAS